MTTCSVMRKWILFLNIHLHTLLAPSLIRLSLFKEQITVNLIKMCNGDVDPFSQRAINIQRLETSIQTIRKYRKFKRRNRDLYHVTSIEQTSFKAELCKIIAIIVIVFTPVFIDFKGSIIEYFCITLLFVDRFG